MKNLIGLAGIGIAIALLFSASIQIEFRHGQLNDAEVRLSAQADEITELSMQKEVYTNVIQNLSDENSALQAKCDDEKVIILLQASELELQSPTEETNPPGGI